MKVPFIDLKAQYESIKSEISIAIQEVIESSAFAGGPFVEKFEAEFAQYCESKYCIGVASGTDALWLILLALGVGPGDEVLTVPNTFIATAEAVSLCGAKPVFVDVDARTFTMNPSLLEAAITRRTKVIIPVHLFGQIADMDPITDIAHQKGLTVVEDACQAHGASYKGRKAGSIGRAAAFSFYPGKNLGAYGEAGAVTTNDAGLAQKIRMLRDHGQRSKYYHDIIGMNARMDGIQGAVLSVKLRHLDAWNDARIRHAASYDELLSKIPKVAPPFRADFARHIYHVYGVLVPNRDRVLESLKDKGVSCGIHYPVPVHLQNAYAPAGLKKGILPVSENAAERLISLPMFPELSAMQIEFVADSIKQLV